MAAPSAAAAPVGGADAQTKGVFGAPVTWPIIGLHVVLLPDGRVMSYGTDEQGQQGGQFVYDVWDPTLGTDTTAHTVLPNTTGTDIFCSGQSVIAASGEVLITGGDLTINGERNFSNQQTEIFHPQTNAITTAEPMLYARWYPTVVALPTGEMLVLGGRRGQVRHRRPDPRGVHAGMWAGGRCGAPRAMRLSEQSELVLSPRGRRAQRQGLRAGLRRQHVLSGPGRERHDHAADAANARRGPTTCRRSCSLPARFFRCAAQQKVIVVDLNGQQPVITPTANIDQLRFWSNATVLADGKVLVTGGSAVANQLTGVAYAAEIWDPATGQWTLGASAVKPRLYHSTALLLPDGSVLTAGGGAPGPVKNLNAEIYYPAYLYDASGQPAARPSIVNAPGPLQLHLNQQFAVTVGSADPISRVTLVRTGSATHAFDSDQRFLQLGFTQAGQTLTITAPDQSQRLAAWLLHVVRLQPGRRAVSRKDRSGGKLIRQFCKNFPDYA